MTLSSLPFVSIAEAGRALRAGDTSSVALATLMLVSPARSARPASAIETNGRDDSVMRLPRPLAGSQRHVP
ncbi:MAG: hypothetical protein AAF769_15850, partial [Pseudomonadota bacterium]